MARSPRSTWARIFGDVRVVLASTGDETPISGPALCGNAEREPGTHGNPIVGIGQQGQQRQRLLSSLRLDRLLAEERTAVDSDPPNGVADGISNPPTIGQNQAVSGIDALGDFVRDELRDAAGLFIDRTPLDVVDFPGRVLVPRSQRKANTTWVSLDQRLSHVDDALRTPTADDELDILRAGVVLVELSDAFGICPLE
jgi:hypothetical protein